MTKRILIFYFLILSSASVFSGCSEEGYTDDKIRTVLVLGNSILAHGPSNCIGWHGSWGMAASAKDSDFVHRLIKDIHQLDPSVALKFKTIVDFERDFDTYTLSNLDSLRNPDMLIMKIGENVNDEKALNDNFIRHYDNLIKYLAPSPNSIKVIVDGFWANSNVNSMIREYASVNKYPGVSITYLSNDQTNMAIGKFEHAGVASHPSDKGMRMIEQKIWNSIKGCFVK